MELLSRSARSWRSERRLPRPLQDWDFSELVTATDEVEKALASGEAIAKRPPRTGVSGTYFFCKDDEEERKLAVFKPMDEEALSIDMSPSPPSSAPIIPLLDSHELLPGPAVPSYLYSPMCSPPRSTVMYNGSANFSSDSEQGSHTMSPNGFHSGEGAYREVAAYLLDHDRFARVPQTALVQWLKFAGPSSHTSLDSSSCQHISSYKWSDSSAVDMTDPAMSTPPSSSSSSQMLDRNYLTKKGAFQVYVPNLGDADDFGPGVFDKDQVHRIAAFDIRTLNHDRHGGNILVTKSNNPTRRFDMIPIDHGYILPDLIQAVPWPVWMDWPMIREPPSDETKKYILYLDPDMEARKLRDEFSGVLRPEALQGLKIATMLLQKGIAAGLTLYEIGLLMYSKRNGNGERTELEKIVREANEASVTRECHLENDSSGGLPESPSEPHHRRHQSMTNLDIHDLYKDDFVVKYVGRRIHELVKRVAARSISDKASSYKPKSSYISRARSIPDFGIGAKPVHAIINRSEPNHYGMEVPASSPVASPMPVPDSCRANFQIERMLPTSAPIDIPVMDQNVIKINLPDQLETDGCRLQSLPFTRATNSHVSNHSMDLKNVGLNGYDAFSNGIDGGQRSGTNLPPIGPRISGRKCKSSPVSTMEPFKWEQMSQR